MTKQISKKKKQRRDFIIIAALQEEYEAICEAFDVADAVDEREPFPKVDCKLVVGGGREFVTGSVFKLLKIGRLEAAILATHILETIDTRLILLVGIAGAIRRRGKNSNVDLGDVLFATSIVNGEYRKLTYNTAVSFGEEVHPISADLTKIFAEVGRKARSFQLDSYTKQDGRILRRPPKFHCGAMISVPSVLSDADVIFEIATNRPSDFPIAVEMEAIGLVTAAKRLNFEGRCAMIRAVNDFADEGKRMQEHSVRRVGERTARKRACDNSAFATLEFVKHVALKERWGS